MATLWRVEDEGAAFFARRFYHHLRALPPAEAAAAAQNDLQRNDRWSHPYYWAGYTVSGGGGSRVPSPAATRPQPVPAHPLSGGKSMTTIRLNSLAALLATLAVASCGDGPAPLLAPDGGSAARGGTKGGGTGGGGKEPSVSAAEPSYGKQGQTLDVVVYGSGFDETSEAAWEIDGAPAIRVHTNTTTFVSSSEVVANISIDADADLALYNVAVTSLGGRKKGVGIEQFEVTAAVGFATLGGNSSALGVTDEGKAAGFSGAAAAYWYAADAPPVALGSGVAWDLDEAATVVVGITDRPVYWTGSATNWSGPHALPMSKGATAGRAFAIASDPTSGAGFLIGGSEAFPLRGKSERHEPMLWRWSGSEWLREPLQQPFPDPSTSSWANDVNARGEAVGAVDVSGSDRLPVFWDDHGSPVVLSQLGGTAQGISEDGSTIVGDVENQATAWKRDDLGGWTPETLPGDCTRAWAVDASGLIAAGPCGGFTRLHSVILTPSAAGGYNVTELPGLGGVEAGRVEAISRGGRYVSGSAPTRTVTLATRWTLGIAAF